MTQNTTSLFVFGDKDEFDPERFSDARNSGIHEVNGAANGEKGGSDTMRFPNRHPETGINVLIVGAGIAGLMAALECWRKGHNVINILERNDGPIYTGEHKTLFRNCHDAIDLPAL
jgi:hypothetical protein